MAEMMVFFANFSASSQFTILSLRHNSEVAEKTDKQVQQERKRTERITKKVAEDNASKILLQTHLKSRKWLK